MDSTAVMDSVFALIFVGAMVKKTMVSIFVRRPVRESHFSGLSRQVDPRVLGWGGGSCSPFFTGGHKCFPKFVPQTN